jgi:hypothetical protein
MPLVLNILLLVRKTDLFHRAVCIQTNYTAQQPRRQPIQLKDWLKIKRWAELSGLFGLSISAKIVLCTEIVCSSE